LQATVGAVAILSPSSWLYSAQPIIISSSCKCEAANEHAKLIQTVLDATNARKDITRVRIVLIASNGESRQGKALAKLTYITPLACASLIYGLLAHLKLFDIFVGVDDIIADKDYKHIFKQLHNTLLCKKGSMVHSIKLTQGLICKHLSDSGLTPVHIEHILNPTDKQDIVLAYHLLKDLWTLPPADPDMNN
jgi:hypothetical protein